MNTIKILHSNQKCAKWMEISGCKMDSTCSVGYNLVVHVEKFVRSLCLQKLHFFCVFSLVQHAVLMHTTG